MLGVVVDLSAQAIVDDGFGEGGVLLGIENLAGTASADVLTGDLLANQLDGRFGDDTLALDRRIERAASELAAALDSTLDSAADLELDAVLVSSVASAAGGADSAPAVVVSTGASAGAASSEEQPAALTLTPSRSAAAVARVAVRRVRVKRRTVGNCSLVASENCLSSLI